jgi:AraC family transcriptional regulator
MFGAPLALRDHCCDGVKATRMRNTTAGFSGYGQQLARSFALDGSAALVGRWNGLPLFEVTRLTRIVDELGLRTTLPTADGFLILLHLADGPPCALWRGERLWCSQSFRKDDLIIVDPLDHVRISFDGSIDVLGIYMARQFLEHLTKESGRQPVRHLACWPGTADPLVAHLGAALLPLMNRDRNKSPALLEHVAMALGVHLAWRFGSPFLP